MLAAMCQRSTVAALVMGAVVVAACAATMNVSSYVQRGLDFTQYRTYDWSPADALPTGDPRFDKDPFFQDHMQGAVERHLVTRGYQRVASGTPDLLIHYHASITQRIDVNRSDREHGYCYDESCSVRVVDFEAGTLVVDLIDARTNRLVWRGWAQESLGDMLDNPDHMARRIEEAVSRILAQLPPGVLTSRANSSRAGGR